MVHYHSVCLMGELWASRHDSTGVWLPQLVESIAGVLAVCCVQMSRPCCSTETTCPCPHILLGLFLGRTVRTFWVDGEQLHTQFIIVELICFEGHRIHLFSSHIFNIPVDFVASAAWTVHSHAPQEMHHHSFCRSLQNRRQRGFSGDVTHQGPHHFGNSGY